MLIEETQDNIPLVVIKVSNDQPHDIDFVLEPMGRIHKMPAGAVFKIVLHKIPVNWDLVVAPNIIQVYGCPKFMSVYYQDEKLEF